MSLAALFCFSLHFTGFVRLVCSLLLLCGLISSDLAFPLVDSKFESSHRSYSPAKVGSLLVLHRSFFLISLRFRPRSRRRRRTGVMSKIRVVDAQIVLHGDHPDKRNTIYSLDFQPNGTRLATAGGGTIFLFISILR